MKTFTVYRRKIPNHHNPDQANPPDQPQFEGVVFSDGTVAVRWLTEKKSTSVELHGGPSSNTWSL